MRRGLALLTALGALFAGAGWDAPARAAEPLDETVAPFWQAAHNPGLRRARALVRQGRAQLYPALGVSALFAGIADQRRAALDNALARFSRAARLAPRDPEILLLSAQALSLWEAELPNGLVQRRDEEAIARYLQLRALAPDYEPYQVAFDLGILYTREGAFEEARAEYQRALAVRLDEASVSAVTANLAEVTMMSGDLDAAARLYADALRLGAGEERLLPMWGLAVALDRLGEHAAAQDRALRAAREDRSPMAALNAPGVFFVPAHELHYYTGLGHAALASEALGHPLSSCGGELRAPRALEGATRELLLRQIQLTERLRSLQPTRKSLDALHARAASLLQQRNDAVRHGHKRLKADSPTASAFSHTLHSLLDYRRYLAYGGAKGPWAEDAKRHAEEAERCLDL